jgi:hypothetical protein
LIYFNINHRYIASVLCEQKEVPQNECDGSCWLKKELNKVEDSKSNQLPPTKIEIPDFNYLCQFEACKMKNFAAIYELNYTRYKGQIPKPGYLSDIFHPPNGIIS